MKPIIEKTLIFGHRGASAHLPQNTLEAFELAHKMGAEGIELDVRFSADGEVIVTHEVKLEKLTEATGNIADLTLAELKELDFGYQFYNGERKGFKIPTLDEVFEVVKPLGMTVNVEIKLPSHELVEKCAAIVKRHGVCDKTIYSSFNHYPLKWLREVQPEAYIAPLHHWNLLNAWNYCVDIGAPAAHPDKKILMEDKDYVKNCHDKGIRVHAWTANTPEDIQLLLDMGVDVIMTDYPDVGVQLRDNMYK